MKRQYVPVTLDAYLNESKSITLKRKYGERQPVVVGANAPLRNQVLAFVSEGKKVSKVELKKFIAGLNEASKNPVAAATMWLKRNEKFFVTESKNGVTYYKLSTIGKRLSNRFTPVALSESEEKNIRTRLAKKDPLHEDYEEDEYEAEAKPGSYDFVDRVKGYERPGLNDVTEGCDEADEGEEEEKMDEAAKERIKRIIENIKSKNKKKLNEADEEDEEDSADELTFDDLDLGAEDEAEGEEEEAEGEEDETEGDELEGEEEEAEGEEDETEGDELEGDDLEGDDLEGDTEKVEITEFVITVDDVDEAIGELAELEVDAEQVVDEEGEAIEDQVKVKADDWEALKGWLEEKGVDIEEMFGGEIEVEDELEGGDELDDLEGDDDLDLGGEEDDLEGDLEADDLDLDAEDGLMDLGGEEGDVEGEEFSLDDFEEADVEESVTGMEGPQGEKKEQKWANQPGGKGVVINITGT